MPVAKALFSSEKHTWNTPTEVLLPVISMGTIGLDPCSNDTSIVLAVTEWRLERDGDSLAKDWSGYGPVFVNPPYGRETAKWVRKCSLTDAEIFLLVPARTDTKWFGEVAEFADAVCFWSGRIKFIGAPSSAPFPSMLAYYGDRSKLFVEIFSQYGLTVKL